MSQRGAVKHRRAPSGTPAGVYVGLDDGRQITLMIADDWAEAKEVALSRRQAASLGWHLLALAEPRSAAGSGIPGG